MSNMSQVSRTLYGKKVLKQTERTSYRLIKWMQKKRLLRPHMKCHKCRQKMKMISHPCTDYYIRFSQGLTMRQVDMLQDGLSKSSSTLSSMSKKICEICVRSLKRYRKARGQRVGGADIVIHIDESKFSHKQKSPRCFEGSGTFGSKDFRCKFGS